jgi:ATP-dependent Clp protease, protease subunit
MMNKEFEKYATKHLGINGNSLNAYQKYVNTMNLPVNHSTTPIIIEERKMNVAMMSVFDRLMIDRIIWILGEIEEVGAAILQAQLMFMDNIDQKEITIHIDSPGGDVAAGLGIISVFEYINSPIKTINTGTCCSMGAGILAAGKKGRRHSLRFARTMIHQSSGVAHGNIQDAKIRMAVWDEYNEELLELLAGYCKKSVKQIKEDMQRDKWMKPKEAVEYGLIDSVIVPKPKN